MPKSSQLHLPPELEARLEKQFGVSAVRAMHSAFLTTRLPTLRTNTLKSSDEEIMGIFRDENIQYERVRNVPHAFRIRNRTSDQLLVHPMCVSGKIYLQGVASMLPPLVLAPKAGESILDLCAAPGSKTSQMAAMMTFGERKEKSEKWQLVALEENQIRFQKLQHTLQLQGADFVTALHADATLAAREYPEAFDKILADVPCSAEGRIDLHDPRTIGFWSEKNIVAHAKLQRRLLRAAVGCLKHGGTLVYSTCTLAPEENELMIDWLLAEFPEMRSEPIDLPVASKRVHTNKSITVLPTIEHEGFFVAKLNTKHT